MICRDTKRKGHRRSIYIKSLLQTISSLLFQNTHLLTFPAVILCKNHTFMENFPHSMLQITMYTNRDHFPEGKSALQLNTQWTMIQYIKLQPNLGICFDRMCVHCILSAICHDTAKLKSHVFTQTGND